MAKKLQNKNNNLRTSTLPSSCCAYCIWTFRSVIVLVVLLWYDFKQLGRLRGSTNISPGMNGCMYVLWSLMFHNWCWPHVPARKRPRISGWNLKSICGLVVGSSWQATSCETIQLLIHGFIYTRNDYWQFWYYFFVLSFICKGVHKKKTKWCGLT